MKKIAIVLFIAIIVTAITSCTQKPYEFNEEFENIVSIEIVEAEDSKNFTVKKSLSDSEMKDFLTQFQKLKFGQSFGDPISIHGTAIKITYYNGNYEIITHYFSEFVEDDTAYLLFIYCDEKQFASLIDDFS